MRRIKSKLAFIIPIYFYLTSAVIAADIPVIAIASNMTHAMSEIIDLFTVNYGIKVKTSYGSSGNFTRQIIQGAPFDLFLSADKKYVDILQDKNFIVDPVIPYARGRIGILVPHGSIISNKESLNDVINTLKYGQYRRIAIANPEHAPFGMAAREALQTSGIWAITRSRLIIAENAAQATQFTLAGGVDAGIISSSFTLLPELSGKGKFFIFPETWHQPIQQYLVLLNKAGDNTKILMQYLTSTPVKNMLLKHGYSTDNN